MRTIQEVPELAGVLECIQGDSETGEALIENADIVVFTGSVENGRKVAEACARRFIPVFLELWREKHGHRHRNRGFGAGCQSDPAWRYIWHRPGVLLGGTDLFSSIST